MEDINLDEILEQKNLEAFYDINEEEGVIVVVDKNTDLYGLANHKGEILVDTVYYEIDYFYDGYASAKKEANGKWGCIDINGKEIIPFIFDQLISFEGGMAAVVKDGKYGCIDKAGNVIFPFKVPVEAFFDAVELYDFIGGYSLNRISIKNFNNETAPLFSFIAERKIRTRVEELLSAKKLSQQAHDILEEKMQEKIKQANNIIDEKVKQNICENEIGEDIVEELDSLI